MGELVNLINVQNPYWDLVEDAVFADHRPWGVEYQIQTFPPLDNPDAAWLKRHDFVRAYSWTIPDPATLAFVVEWCQGLKILDPLAGTGYWAFLLSQYGIDVFASDADPFNNVWHAGATLHHKIVQMDCVDAVRHNQDRTLFLSWIPYGSSIGQQMLDHYTGNRIIHIGEHLGCTADEEFFDRLESGWDEVASHRPIQWFGMHDYVTIYERKAITDGR